MVWTTAKTGKYPVYKSALDRRGRNGKGSWNNDGMSDRPTDIAALAAACASRLPASSRSFRDDAPGFLRELDTLVAAVAQSDVRYAFDVEGRPGAIAAIRHALPAMEAELFDAVLEDVACELAARQEALYQVTLAARPSRT
jgi:hypothetical protein